jgi:hypothetical protein
VRRAPKEDELPLLPEVVVVPAVPPAPMVTVYPVAGVTVTYV